jgi:hypothetical protein
MPSIESINRERAMVATAHTESCGKRANDTYNEREWYVFASFQNALVRLPTPKD